MKIIVASYALVQVLCDLETCGVDSVPLTVEDNKLTISLSHITLFKKAYCKSEQNTPKDGIR